MLTRRHFVMTGTLAAVNTAALPYTMYAKSLSRFSNLPALLAQLEHSNSCRLGVAVLDTASGERTGHRSDERFAMCSTFKMLLAAAVLQRVDAGHERLNRNLSVPARPLVSHSPVTEEHAGAEMTVSALCDAILTQSDNTAANLLLDTLGGPGGVTLFARSIDDKITRLDRTETSLNEALPGDPRDTTSPSAMVENLQKLLLGNVISTSSRNQLIQWMVANTYGDTRLRKTLSANWKAADKTGANGETTTNDIAIFWPPHHPPVLIAAYLTECPGSDDKRNTILAEVGRIVVSCVTAT
ncbi:class A beta-lactamase [Granulicella sp. S190]|uniref:class A beta-lactamase n=1 Tax=Granulicella sp. S190 TaxID=1747226 RepID=UPI00131CB7E3|nr:class A beta-lactamase [Granulicella sp. S190]